MPTVAWSTNITKKAEFNTIFYQEIWKKWFLDSLDSQTDYVLPKYAQMKIMYEPNMGLGRIKIPFFYPLKDDSLTVMAFDTMTEPEPLKGKASHTEAYFARWGGHIMVHRDFKYHDPHYEAFKAYYSRQLVKQVAMKKQLVFRDELLNGTMGTTKATRFFAPAQNGAEVTTFRATTQGPKLEDLITIRNAMKENYTLDVTGTTSTFAPVPGYQGGSDYLVVHHQRFFDAISQSQKFRDLINAGFGNAEYTMNQFRSYFGLKFEKINWKWEETVTESGTAYTRDVAMVIGGAQGSEAIASIEFNHKTGLEYWEINPGREVGNAFNLIQSFFGVMFYYGVKVLRPEAVYLYIYKDESRA